ncbi:effector of murein hydrolase LrgA protein [Herbaspirillum rubrisubalbicans M1]|uniref:CidA/LrgA family protein n=1 Tax=Herbaspirillum rubrisubalbicans TaxID=80842 RepID=UPI00073A0B4B|nr:CidA/LrgA family protein [Herbaspirillum rubrisubalbicans]ALU90093.1 effector of murein hydrolase LrgA protein [Herbaspirillum rubrisubalbicans M1]
MNLTALALLLVFQCLGEGAAQLLGLPIPGPVIGMLLLLMAFLASPRLAQMMEPTSWSILQHLSLLFVPAGVGVIAAAGQLKGDLPAIVVALVVSTVLAIAVGALVTNAAMRRFSSARQARTDEESH